MNFLKCFRPTGSLFLGLAFLFTLSPRAAAQVRGSLPEEPRPAVPVAIPDPSPWLFGQSLPTKASPQAASPIEHAPRARRKWAQYIDPGEKVPPLSAGDKILFSFHRSLVPSALIPVFTSAGFGQLTGGNPKYGVDSGAFGDRLGGDALRQVSMRFFVLGVIPVIDRSDPRYLRKASGSPVSRVGWAAERTWVTQRDSGRPGFNEADIFGHLAASLLTMAYYPAPSVNAHVVLETFLVSIAGTTGNNEFLEFWPDILNAWHRHRARVRARRSPMP
ncbi:MAG: hypothetical protein WBW84_12060 [Acidobacteriaceae bacterium]